MGRRAAHPRRDAVDDLNAVTLIASLRRRHVRVSSSDLVSFGADQVSRPSGSVGEGRMVTLAADHSSWRNLT